MKGVPRASKLTLVDSHCKEEKILIVLAKIGEFIFVKFNGLKKLTDWGHFYGYLSLTFQKDLYASHHVWNPTEVQPANPNDLFWKTKVRLLSMHTVGFADIESQKRTASFSAAMMGIIPVNRIDSCNVHNTECLLPENLNDCQFPFNAKNVKVASSSLLVENQGKTMNLQVGLLKGSKHQFDNNVERFFQAFSGKKANAASTAQVRTWQDMALRLCDSVNVQQMVVPADYSKLYFDTYEDMTTVTAKGFVKDPNYFIGIYLLQWAKDCQQSILESISTMHDSPYVRTAMPKEQQCGTDKEFMKIIVNAWGKKNRNFFTLPNKLPKVPAVHAMTYLIFLVGPADANADTPSENSGLKNLKSIIKSKGGGGHMVDQEQSGPCWSIRDKQYTQSVSKATNQR